MSYLDQYDRAAEADKFPLVRRWLDTAALPFVDELRTRRPILATPVCTLVAKSQDVVEVLRLPSIFTVDLYKPMMGDFMLAQDDTPIHQREKGIMHSMLNRDETPKVRQLIRERAKAIVDAAPGRIEVVNELTRRVPVILVQEYFGLVGIPEQKLIQWSYWNQYDAFHNQPFDLVEDGNAVRRNRESAILEMRQALADLVRRRVADIKAGTAPDDIVCRLLRTSYPQSVGFPIERLVLNIGGLLIGTVETTSQAAAQALQQLLRRPEALARAKAAAEAGDDTTFDAYVFEALRLDPILSYLFRKCVSDYVLARGTARETLIKAGTLVLPLTLAAMSDPDNTPNPQAFKPERGYYDRYTFGYGLHECLGKHIGQVMVPELVRQLVLRPNLAAVDAIDFRGTPFPEHYEVTWG